MAEFNELVQALTWLVTNRIQQKIDYTHGLLGDGNGRIRVSDDPDNPNIDFVYVRPDRSSNRTFKIFNKRVQGEDGDPIIMGELPWEPNLIQVIDIDWSTYKNIGWGQYAPNVTYHGKVHEWRDGAPGLDAFNVYRRQIGDLKAVPSTSGTSAIDISSYSMELLGVQKQFGGIIGFPLDGAIPAGTGTARMALVYWDPSSGTTGSLGIASGTLGVDTDAALLNRAVSPPGSIPIAHVRLAGGASSIAETDIWDAREPFRPGLPFDGAKVSKVYESDFENVALQTTADGEVFIGPDPASGTPDNTEMTIGITINQEGNSNEILAFKSSSVAHGMTSIAETDTYGFAEKHTSIRGGVRLTGLTETDVGLNLEGAYTNDYTSKNTGSLAAIQLIASKKSGTTTTTPGADANMVAIKARGTTRVIFDAEGTIHQIPDSDTDIDLLTVQVTNDPTISWDESEDAFSLDRGLQVVGGAAAAVNSAIYAGDGDGTDAVNLELYGVGTPASKTNREKLLIQYDSAQLFRIQSEANGTGVVRDLVIETDGNSNQLYLDATDGYVGMGIATPAALLDISRSFTDGTRIINVDAVAQPSAVYWALDFSPQLEPSANITTVYSQVNALVLDNSSSNITTRAIAMQNQVQLKGSYSGTVTESVGLNILGPQVLAGTVTTAVGLRVNAHTTGGTNNRAIVSATAAGSGRHNLYISGTADNYLEGDTGVGISSPSGKLHVDQSSTTAAIPVLYLDQADISEEMIQFETTIGTGNAIEAVGGKTLTTTHFIKVTLPGGLTRYIPVGTIA